MASKTRFTKTDGTVVYVSTGTTFEVFDPLADATDYPTGWISADILSVVIGSNVTTIGNNAFKECTSLVSVTIPNSVTTIGANAFYQCNSLTTVVIPDSVTTLGTGTELNDGGPFQFCTSLTSVTLPNNSNFTTLKPTTFFYCSALESIVIPDSVTSIGDAAFAFCGALQSVT